ncbi:MAG: DUF2784 domain-containing protein [Thermodesulfobacteriota bacterium]|nr:DUF2784 domain-containing protein [Thermodesulfobacteriota bacterium]
MFSILADAVLIAHLAFIIFVIFGAVIIWHFKSVAFFHIPSLIWALVIEFFPQCPCPLTPLEQFLRTHAEGEAYEGGFIDRYVDSLIYPGITLEMHFWAGILLFVFNGILYGFYFLRLKKQ